MDSVSLQENYSHAAITPLSIDIPSPARLSMEDHFNKPSRPESPATTIDESVNFPPSYDADALMHSPHTQRKYNIQPREDEGRETLPEYSSQISLENVFSRKVELEGAIHRASDRKWYRVCVTLQGTALTFHKYKTSPYFLAWASKGSRSDVVVPGKKGLLLKSYNLQHADAGIAADYFKRRYVIRVRAETDQFLLSCFKIETFVHWLQSLIAAIDIAPPLDTRSLPRDFSIPRVRRRRQVCSTSDVDLERNAALVREQYEIMRRRYPNLVGRPVPEGAEQPRTGTPTTELQRLSTASAHTAPLQISPSLWDALAPILSHADRLERPRTYPMTAFSSSTAISEAHPSLCSETGKWRPEHQWSATYDMLYAKRCMAILTDRSPRKSDLVIMKGKQWVVDWATGALTRCEPPDYGEIALEKGGGRARVWQTVGNVNAKREAG